MRTFVLDGCHLYLPYNESMLIVSIREIMCLIKLFPDRQEAMKKEARQN
jgi:hypothetical protein